MWDSSSFRRLSGIITLLCLGRMEMFCGIYIKCLFPNSMDHAGDTPLTREIVRAIHCIGQLKLSLEAA